MAIQRTGGVALERLWKLCAALLFLFVAVAAGRAQGPAQIPPPPPPPPAPVAQTPPGYAIQRDVSLVELHVSVTDEYGQFVSGFGRASFLLFEDNVQQKITTSRLEDAPVSMGLLIDNSGSMEDKRAGVNAASLTFVKTSNPDDEVFVAHFNENYSFDLNKDFTNDLGELQKALERAEPDGATALYDAVIDALNHLKKGYRDKKVLLIISDGEDNRSRVSLAYATEQAQRSDVMIYAVGLLSQEKPEAAQRARQALITLTQATGGAAFFPEGVPEVDSICEQIARDIRHQYTIGYYPTNGAKDGSFRTLRVEVIPPPGSGKLSVRTRTGYFAHALPSVKENDTYPATK